MSDLPRRRRGRGGQGGHEPRARIRTRERRTMELMVLGWSQQQIAVDLGVSQAAVSKILTRVEGRLLRELTAMVERHKVRHSMRLDHLFAEAMRAWDQSKADTTRRRQRRTQGGHASAGATIAEIVVENQHGDPRYLDEARKALADQRKLWGLDAPQQVDVRASRSPYDGMTEEALQAEFERQARLLSASDATTTDRTDSSPADPCTTTSQEAADADDH
jgi:predicted transcriptional regulator